MNKILFVLLLVLIVSCSKDNQVETSPFPSIPSQSVYYEVDLSTADRILTDKFKVKCIFNEVAMTSDIFQFPATIPGVYGVYNYGAFVDNFHAFTKDNLPLSVTRLSSNEFQIGDFTNLYRIEYEVNESFNRALPEPYPTDFKAYSTPLKMAGTSVEMNHALLQGFALFGSLKSNSTSRIFINIKQPSNWVVGTSAQKMDGLYTFNGYEELYDNPILIGNTGFLTSDKFTLAGTEFKTYVYSPTKKIQALQVRSSIERIMRDANEFMGGFLISKYSFVFFCGDQEGALEHLNSSLYALSENTLLIENNRYPFEHIIAHEFFHTLTPLNVRSEIIDQFSFIPPRASEHLWFYEGVTEWAALLMRYRGGSLPLESNDANNLLFELSTRNSISHSINFTLSLRDVGLNCYSNEGRINYKNIYNKGALVSALLDIQLLELSHGKKGLRELLNELSSRFDKDKPFSENDFFSLLVSMSYPEIQTFLDKYVINNQELPLNEYFNKIGIDVVYDSQNSSTTMTKRSNQQPNEQILFDAWSKNF